MSSVGGKFSVIVPTLNEAENIGPLIDRILESTGGFDLEIIVVDDASRDGTAENARELSATRPIRVVERKVPANGLAGAVLAGAEVATNEVVVVMDADLSHPPDRLPELVRPVLDGSCDMVIGSRYAPGGSTPGWSRKRRWMSRAASAAAWPLTDVHDSLSGFFAVRRELLRQIPADAAGFKIALEVLVRGGDELRVGEIPITFRDRTLGESKMGTRVILTYFRRLLALSGWRESEDTPVIAVAKSVAVLLTDFCVFPAGMALGLGLSAAQIAGFTLATILNLFLKVKQLPDRRPPGLQFFFRFALVALMSFSLRGGALATCAKVFGWPPLLAILPAIFISAFTAFLGYALFIWPVREQYGRGMRWRVAALGVVAFLLALRVVYCAPVELLPEEAYYWNYAQHPALSYLDHPPMVAWLISCGTFLLGHNSAGVRLGALGCWLIAAFFIFRLARDFFDKTVAFRAVMLLALLPAFFGIGTLMTPDAPLIACWAGALYFFARVFFHNSAWSWIGAATCLGVGMDSKYTIALVGFAAVVFTLLDRDARRWLRHPAPYLAAVLSVALFAPVIAWNAENEWASFLFQSSRRMGASTRFSLHELLLSALVLLTPVGLFVVFRVFAGGEKPGTPQRRRLLFVRTFALLPLAVFTYFSIRHRVEFNWTSPLWLVALPSFAATLAPAEPRRDWIRGLWVPTFVALIVGYGVTLYHLALGWPGVPYPAHMELFPVGWSSFAAEVERAEVRLESETGAHPMTVGMDRYQIISELTFYDPDQREAIPEGVGAHLFGQRSLMFERWVSKKSVVGKNMILVGLDRDEVMLDSVPRHFARVSDPIEGRITHNGKFVRSFFYRIGYDYRAQRSD
ncbi:MAG: dolichol-phosphate mannosyltransferase [Chthoniobacter sp.]|nr:dolichol-phosphate mannosyltransferase [Chthoniobacter sp.]